jgi:8-amino-7-oxononanoate synthase
MDGDVAPLAELFRLKEQYDTLLVIDEAHAFGVAGPQGLGYTDVYFSRDARGGSPLGQGNPDPSSAAGANGIERAEPFQSHEKTPVPAFAGTGVFIVGTFGKACGSYGAFVACEAHWRQEFIQSARSFIYSTGLPLPVLAWNLAVVSQLGSYAALREKLWAQVAYFRDKIRTLSPLGCSMIVPVLCNETHAERVVRALRDAGFWVACVRYPTVPKGQSRLRLSLCADHSEAALSALAAQLLSLLPVQDG